jgi:Ca-activated chloride channel family protein
MKFISIKLLFLIWTIPVLLLFFFYGMYRRNSILSRFGKPRGLNAIASEPDTTRRWVKNTLLLVVILFSAIAIAGPQYGYRWEAVEQKGVDIILAIDCSRSMLATDIQPTRLDRAKREIVDLLQLLEGDRVGLVTFAGTAFLQCPLTLDYSGFHIFLNALSPDFLPIGGTNINAAITTALSAFSDKDNTEKAIILITDGESTGDNPVKAAETVLSKGIKLFCIGVGSTDGVPVPDANGGFIKDDTGKIVLTRLDEQTLKEISLKTKGAYVRSIAGDMDLDVIYRQKIRNKMQSATLSTGKKKVMENRYQWFLGVGLVAFCFEFFIRAVKPKTGHGLFIIGFLLLAIPGIATAEGVYEKMQKGVKAYENQNYEKSLDYFTEAQLEKPDLPEISYNLGNAYYKTEDYLAAEKNYFHALNTQSDFLKEKAFYNLGNTYFRTGDYEKAVENYQAALKIDPEDNEASANLEFVKKILEQQKKSPSKTNQTDGKPQDKDNDSENGSAGQPQSDKKKQPSEKTDSQSTKNLQTDDLQKPETSTPSYGKEMEPEMTDQLEESAQGGGKTDDTENRKTSEETAMTPQKQQSISANQIETMLNRLEDQPGKALVPSYGNQKVQKDW